MSEPRTKSMYHMRPDLYCHMCMNCPNKVCSKEYVPKLGTGCMEVHCSRKTCTEFFQVFN